MINQIQKNFSPTLLTLCIATSFSYQVHAENFDCTVDGQVPEFTSIQAIQGSGETSPFINGYPYITEDEYFVKGVVTAVTSSLTKGFYLQALENDGDENTSEGIFVHTNAKEHTVKAGDVVCVKGKIQEYYDNTQLKSDLNSLVKLSETAILPATPLLVKENGSLRETLERYEGMQVRLTKESALFVSRNFSYDYAARRNNLMLSYQAPLFKPTQLFAAASKEAKALATLNTNSRLYVESDLKAKDGELPYYPDFAKDLDQNDTSEHHIRVGSRLEGLEGVLSYSYGEYRLIATNEISNESFVTKDTHFDVTRKDKPSINRSDLQVASFNVLNYFTSFVANGNANPLAQDRGAASFDEFLLQKAKIVSAIHNMDADIIGLMEVENNGFDDGSAIADLVNALNAKELEPSKHYRYVEIEEADKYQDKYFGSDAIMVALLYRPSQVTPAQTAKVIITPEQHIAENTLNRENAEGESEGNPAYDKFQRYSLLQTFTLAKNGESLSVVVNHFKSKGSECIEEWIAGVEDSEPLDLQGNCNNFRVSAAKAVGNALKEVQGDVLLIGDLNAYGMEDPLLALTDYSATSNNYGREIFTAAYTNINSGEIQVEPSRIEQGFGYVNLNTYLHGTNTFSYTYSGELGNLDHALASPSLARKVTAVEDWHINSLESDLFEYSGKYTGEMPKYQDIYSSSDHDPILLSIELAQTKISLPVFGEILTFAVRLPVNTLIGDKVTVRLTTDTKQQESLLTGSTTITQSHLNARQVELVLDNIPEVGNYALEETLTDETGEIIKFSATRQIEILPAPMQKISRAGSTGFGFLLMLIGLFLYRFRKIN